MIKILAIDDKIDNLITLSALLKNLIPGCSIITAMSGPEGLKKAKKDPPDVILLDIKMPEIDGFEVCRRLKALPETGHIPIILITAIRTDAKSRVKGLDLGADAFLAKPIDEMELAAQVKVMLRIKKAEDKLRKEKVHLEDIVRERTEALSLSHKRYKTLFDNASDVMFIHKMDGNFIDVNEAACKKLGYKRLEFLYLTPGDITLEEEKERIPELIDKLKKNNKHFYETFLVTKSGEILSVEINSSLITFGVEKAVLSIARDVSERKKADEALKTSETRYRELINNMTSGVAVYRAVEEGRNFVFVDFNRAAEKIEGIKREDLLGKSVTEAFPAVKEFGLFKVFQKVWQSGMPEHFPLTFYKDKRVAGWRENYVYKLPCGEIVSVYDDLTKEKQVEEERNKLREQLHHAQKMEALGTLAGGIAHDFNNILGGILGYTELALDDIPEDTITHRNLKHLLKACYRAKDLVKQILAFSRHSEHKREPLQFSIILKEALKLIRASIPSTIKIRSHIKTEHGIILADATQIHQVIMNLVTNSSHAMKEKGGFLNISLKDITLEPEDIFFYQNLKPGDYLKFTVEDTGYGIKPEIIERIFDPYFTTKKQGEGTGMGLAVVHGIVRSHGGEIKVYSEAGKGTAFHILLPCIESDIEVREEAESPLYGKGESVLFVDDERALVDIGRQILTRLGYRVTVTDSSPEALEYFRNEPQKFSLIITDQTMPEITGMDLIKEIKTINPSTPVILCTGFGDNINKIKLEQYNIDDFILKPVTIKKLADSIRKVLNHEKNV